MTKPPPTLADLRREIDRIDEAMHRLLMERGDIIDTLIATKKTAESGSAFRPAREADMMKRLVERHKGILPLDTAESIWRVIIATFTYVQAPFSLHADLSAGEAAMRDSARVSISASRCRSSATSARAASSRRLRPRAAISASCRRPSASGAWWTALEGDGTPKIIARFPFVERADHPAGLPVFGIARPNPDALVTDVETWSVRVAGWGPAVSRALDPPAEVVAVPDRGFDGAALLVSVPKGQIDALDRSAGESRRFGALKSSRRRSRDPLYRHRRRPGLGRPLAHDPEKRRPVFGEDHAQIEPLPCGAAGMTVLERPQPRPGVLKIQAYVPGKSSAPGVAKVFKLSSNETPLGASPKAIAAYGAIGKHLEDYPDGASTELREAIGRAYGLDPEPHRVRRRLRRSAQPAGARLSAGRRRGDPHHARLPGLSDRDARRRRDAGGAPRRRSTPPTSTRSSPR